MSRYHLFLIIIFLAFFPISIIAQNIDPNEIILSSDEINFAKDIGSIREVKHFEKILQYELINFKKNDEEQFVYYYGDEQRYISLRTTDDHSFGEYPLLFPIQRNFHLDDIDGDSIPEIIFTTVQNFDVYLNIIYIGENKPRKYFLFTGKDYFKTNKFDFFLTDAKALNHSDGKKYLILSLNAGHDESPRGIMALSTTNFKPVWKYFIGSPPWGKILVQDINSDGKQEILFGTNSSENYVSYNGFNDTTSYFIVINENGKELFNHPLAGKLSYTFFNFLSPINNIITFGYTKDDKAEVQPDIIQIDPVSFNILNTHQVNKHPIWDTENLNTKIDYFNNQYFFQYDKQSKITVFDKNLQISNIIQFPFEIKGLHLVSIPKDKKKYLITILKNYADNSYVFLIQDSDFRIIGKKTISSNYYPHFKYRLSKENLHLYFVDVDMKTLLEWNVPRQQLFATFNFNSYLHTHETELIILSILIFLSFAGTSIANIISRKNLHIQKFKSLSDYFLENPVEAIVVFDENGKIESSNNAFIEQFEIKNNDKTNETTFNEILTTIKANELIKYLEEIYLNKRNYYNTETDMTIGDKLHKMKIEIQKIDLDKKHFSVALKFYDFTSFTRADRISNWAAVAQKLAHEIKNPLMSMTLSLGRLEKKIGNEEDANNKYLSFIREDIARMRDSTNQFLKFTSSLDFNFTPCLINDMLTKLIQHYKSIIDKRIVFESNFDASLKHVKIDEEQTKQVLINIIDNAIDAIPEDGIVKIETKLIIIFPRDEGLEKKYAQIIISDNGMGIANDNLSKIFEPNYTTKKTGAGFGLAIAKHVIEEQNGTISISSKVDVGTVISIELPVSD